MPQSWIREADADRSRTLYHVGTQEYEEKILGAESRILVLEQELFAALLAELAQYTAQIQVNASGDRADRLSAVVRVAGRRTELLPARCQRFVGSRHPRRASPGDRDADESGRGVRSERRAARRLVAADHHHYRPQHVR